MLTILPLTHESLPPTYRALTTLPLLVMVGLTGVGKTTTLAALQTAGLTYQLLPDRRQVTDEIIITYGQRLSGHPAHPVTDRLERFRYTAAYRAQNPGGMAHALSCLAVDLSELPATTPLIFDGLRGLEEVEYACRYFPSARFMILDAPDIVRLSRLLTRGDSFDQTANTGLDTASVESLRHHLAAIADIETVFKPSELTQIAQLPQTHQLDPGDIIKKLKIIVEERRNYDSQAAKNYLSQTLPATQVIIVNTATQTPPEVARHIINWLFQTKHNVSR